ncbi:MAG: biopolymer transporter ExbD [Planctomycetes bacterium]|nr:biopolymer transporter ExbD [Planctomycetota bacterium]
MSHSDAADFEAKSDMTPMIDVVFLMIIFFICIDFKVLEAKLPAYLPKDVGGGPSYVEPREQLVVDVHCVASGDKVFSGSAGGSGRAPRYRLQGRELRWAVGPRPIGDVPTLHAELKRIAADPGMLQSDVRTGARVLPPVVVVGHAGACYDDIARTADAVAAAGFGEVTFGYDPGRR